MKLLGKVLFGVIVMFFGLSLFRCSQQSAFTEAISYEADQAIKNNDYTFFKSIFSERAKDDLLTEVVKDENDEVLFNLNLFLVGSQHNSSIIFLVDSYSKDPRPEALKLVVKTNKESALEYDLVSLGKENWYLQWLHLDNLYLEQAFMEDIIDFKVKDGDKVLYDFNDELGALITANEANIQAYVKKENVAVTYIKETINKDTAVIDEAVSEKGTEKTYKQTFNITLSEETDKEIYVVGNFNNYDLTDKTYELTKDKKKNLVYTGTFDITTDDKDLYYYVLVGDEIVSKEGLAKQFTRTYISQETELIDVNIETVKPVKLNKYQYKIWITMIVYLVIAALSMWAIFFRKKKPVRARYSKQASTPEKEPEKPRENLNLRSIGDIEERDEDLQVHEKETIISVPIEDIEEVEENEE
ncbi:MAG: hypothetical protein GX931_06325 [Acholeplasmataceae bacterium]|jgi:hypothetical protein|nr:hypothetical protein [Acholeplasmataceae bacterium]